MRLLSRKLGDPLRLGIDGDRDRDEWLVWGLALMLLWLERDRLRVWDLLLWLRELRPLELLLLRVWLWDLLRDRECVTEREIERVLLRVGLRDADRLCDRDPLLLDDQLFALPRLEGLKPQLSMLDSVQYEYYCHYLILNKILIQEIMHISHTSL
jgi:hypothetical protein